ncbi:MAG TPA: AAA family ATPase [Thermoplasmata archaeon]|nr:AAA family ATPase [Thermoplasmata archaeon]
MRRVARAASRPGSGTGRPAGYVVIRGPLGVGKTTVARILARTRGAGYVSIDQILDDHGLWDSGRLAEFLAANRVAVGIARPLLAAGTAVVFDGNFYWKRQLDDLIGRLSYPHQVFTLQAPVALCILRDRRRRPSHGAIAARQVYAKATRFEYGISVDATGSLAAVVRRIERQLPGVLRVRPTAPTG